MALTLHYASGSPYAWRVWLAVEHKGIPYELKLLSFDKGDLATPTFRALNPRGRVPALEDDGFALYESAAIVEYLETSTQASRASSRAISASGRCSGAWCARPTSI